MKASILAFAATLLLAPLPAAAQVMADPDVVATFLEDYGLKVTRDKDDQGDPMLSSRIEGIYFDVYFYGCTKGTDCDSIEFSALFSSDQPVDVSVANDWNRQGRFARAYIDEDGNPNLEFDVNLDFDGVGGKNFDDTIDIWRAALSDFRQHINW